ADVARRDSERPQRPPRRDESRRAAAAAGSRLRAAPGLASKAVSRAAGDDRPVADLGAFEPLVRRPRPARLLLPGQLVDLARHLDPRQDDPRRDRPARGVLTVSSIHPAARHFERAADDYERSRPTFPPQAIEHLRRELRPAPP